ncbi:MAG: class I SAM-dependent methyltransferase [Planctomycetes bacterium]|nr:class I SAM-dependent methyltransferase [Planctomycetota bacterium]
MSREDRARWDEKHAAAVAAGRPSAAPAFLDAVAPFLASPAPGASRRALDVACGRGAASVWLAKAWFDVVALDVSLVALAAVRRLADAGGVGRSVQTIVADLDDGFPFDVDTGTGGAGSVEALSFDPFDLVLCVHFHVPTLWPAFRAALAPGGILAIETLTTENLTLGLPAPSAQWLAMPNEVRGAATGLQILHYEEAVIGGSHRARLVARRAVVVVPARV